jgi:hypothetical protein
MKQEPKTKQPLERAWVSLIDSDRFRRFAKKGLGSWFFRSDSYRRLIVAKNYVTTYRGSRANSDAYQELKTYCTFIGPTKSGSTLIGSLLDAHPDAIMADEVDALRYVDAGFSNYQIYDILIRRSRRHALDGRVTARRLQAYDFEIEGQWQGRFQNLRVIGDSKAGMSTRRLGANPALLERLDRVTKDAEPRFIMVIRNPFDPISAMRIRGNRSVENAVTRYFENCDFLAALRQVIDPDRLHMVRYEQFVRQPQRMLRDVCAFLGLSADQEYLDACSAIIYDEPEQIRFAVEWQPAWREALIEKSANYDFLAGYSFEN